MFKHNYISQKPLQNSSKTKFFSNFSINFSISINSYKNHAAPLQKGRGLLINWARRSIFAIFNDIFGYFRFSLDLLVFLKKINK